MRKILTIAVTVLLAIVGLIIMELILPQISLLMGYDLYAKGFVGYAIARFAIAGVGAALFGWVGYMATPFIFDYILFFSEKAASILARVPSGDMVVTLIGVIVGLLLANLLGSAFSNLPIVGPYIPMVLSVIMAVTGAKLASHKSKDILGFFDRGLPNIKLKKNNKKKVKDEEAVEVIEKVGIIERPAIICRNKLLDTSVIIDGRIVDILKTGFLEGNMIVPNFVLLELQALADSSDDMKRAKGRRGLDLVHELQLEDDKVIVEDVDYDDIMGVDSKLLQLAKDSDALIMTNDFNLNKVASIQGIEVLNINELANAVKPVVIPGEEMNAYLLREGKENGQAVAYLQDGTMIVVEGGKRFIGKKVKVAVTSVLQTSAGRMIFAKIP